MTIEIFRNNLTVDFFGRVVVLQQSGRVSQPSYDHCLTYLIIDMSSPQKCLMLDATFIYFKNPLTTIVRWNFT